MPPGRPAELRVCSWCWCNCSASLRARVMPAFASLVMREGSCVFIVDESGGQGGLNGLFAEDETHWPREAGHQTRGYAQTVAAGCGRAGGPQYCGTTPCGAQEGREEGGYFAGPVPGGVWPARGGQGEGWCSYHVA